MGKKISSLCSPQGLALSGMVQGSGVFSRPGEVVLLPLNEKWWGLFTPRPHFFGSFDFFVLKFDHSSYSKICAKYNFFCCGLLYQYKIFKNDLNLTIFA